MVADIDLDVRWGGTVDLLAVARWFHATPKAMRFALQRKGVPVYAAGTSEVVPVRALEEAYGLDALLTDEARHLEAVQRARFRANGEPKPIEEFAAEVDVQAGEWLADIEAARAEGG